MLTDTRTPQFQISKERLRFWGIRSGVAALDQGLTSGASFLLNLFLARWLSAAEYGAFAVSFAILLFLSGYQNVLLLEPMTVLGPAQYSHQLTDYLHTQFKLNLVVVIGLALLMLTAAGAMATFMGFGVLVTTTAGCAVALPPLLLFWLIRRMCYVVQRPGCAVGASAAYFVILILGATVAHQEKILGPATAYVWITAASTLAVIVPVKSLGIFSRRRPVSRDWRKVWRENWTYGRWLVASTTLFSIVNQSQMFIVAGLLGLGAAGILRAMQVPSLAMIQVITAVGLLLLPAFSFDFGRGELQRLFHKARLISTVLGLSTLAFTLLIAVSSSRLERLLYGGKFAEDARLMPILVLMAAAAAIRQGYSMALRAAQRPEFDIISNSIAAPLAIASAVAFTYWWGLTGAAVSIVVGFAAQSWVTALCFRSVSRRVLRPLAFQAVGSPNKL